MGSNSDGGEVEFPVADAELQEEEMEIPYMVTEENFDIPGVDMEAQQHPHKSLRSMIPTSQKIHA